jgi:hypothetical protein
MWAHPFSRVGWEAPVRTEPLPTILSDAFCLGAVVLMALPLALTLTTDTDFQKWMAKPNAAPVASWTASLSVGCA